MSVPCLLLNSISGDVVCILFQALDEPSFSVAYASMCKCMLQVRNLLFINSPNCINSALYSIDLSRIESKQDQELLLFPAKRYFN